MVKFNRYPHVNDLLNHYAHCLEREDITKIIASEISSSEQAKIFAQFIWQMVEAINEDEENNITVLGRTDNTEMLPDISYEVTKLMKDNGYYSVWESVSRDEMG